MREFIDLHGASGATYRFRSWSEGAAHLPMAGNYAVVREDPKGLVVLLAGVSDDLSTARPALTRLVEGHGPAQVYTRLNVSRTVRIAENDDIVAHYQPPLKAES
jgi:hypothetical protein